MKAPAGLLIALEAITGQIEQDDQVHEGVAVILITGIIVSWRCFKYQKNICAIIRRNGKVSLIVGGTYTGEVTHMANTRKS